MLFPQKQCPSVIEYEPRVEEVEVDLAHATFLIDQGGVEDVVERFARSGSIGFRSTGWLYDREHRRERVLIRRRQKKAILAQAERPSAIARRIHAWRATWRAPGRRRSSQFRQPQTWKRQGLIELGHSRVRLVDTVGLAARDRARWHRAPPGATG